MGLWGESVTNPSFSKVSARGRTVIPREVRMRLGIKPGDRLRYVVDESGVRLENTFSRDDENPFATFSEWSSDADEAAYADL